MSRKLNLYAAAIRDPAALSAALSALWSAGATVAAALRVKFARTLVLGVSVAACVQPAARRRCAAPLAAAMAPRHRQWAPTLVDGAVRSLFVAVAWRLQRALSAWHSAARGGAVCAGALGAWAKRKGHLPARVALASDVHPHAGDDSTGPVALGLYADEVLGFLLAAAGLRLQVGSGFGLPAPLWWGLLPLVAAEWGLGVLFLGLGP